jgi:hypothetical protein
MAFYMSLSLRISSTTRRLLWPEGALVATEGVVEAEPASEAAGLQLGLLQVGALLMAELEAVEPVRTKTEG